MISKKLLSEVLSFKVFEIHGEQQDSDGYEDYEYGTVILFNAENRHNSKINIYELANKCKEWATKQGIGQKGALYIKSDTKHSIYNHAVIWHTALGAHWVYEDEESFCEDTEPKAIFKACEWILKEGSKNGK